MYITINGVPPDRNSPKISAKLSQSIRRFSKPTQALEQHETSHSIDHLTAAKFGA
jgi:hypothetical protein